MRWADADSAMPRPEVTIAKSDRDIKDRVRSQRETRSEDSMFARTSVPVSARGFPALCWF